MRQDVRRETRWWHQGSGVSTVFWLIMLVLAVIGHRPLPIVAFFLGVNVALLGARQGWL